MDLYQLRRTRQQLQERFDENTIASLEYHDIFGFPLTKDELVKWKTNFGKTPVKSRKIVVKNGFYVFTGSEGLVLQRKLREKISKEKVKIAKRAALILAKVPTVKMVGVTGSLAMMNAREESDIDLMVVTSENHLWMTRLLSIVLLRQSGVKSRRANMKDEKDMICLNIWMDEGDLRITKKNIYTAHELAQIIPLVNKNKTHERLLWENRWILKFWPNAVKIQKQEAWLGSGYRLPFFEFIAFKLQYFIMKKKITREIVTPTRAFFHPFDWGKYVKARGF